MSSRPFRLLVAGGVILLAGIVAFLATVNRTELAGTTAAPTAPAVASLAVPSVTASLDDWARAQLSRTVTIEALTGNAVGLGTGWLIDTRGDFVTNAHVIRGQQTVRIRARDGSSHLGDVVGVDGALDVAVVRSLDGFAGVPLQPLAAALTSFPRQVVVLASSRATGHGDITDESATAIQPDVPVTGDGAAGHPAATADYHDMLVLGGNTIYPGNSGGPVLDGDGRVVGILTLESRSTSKAYAIQLSTVLAELIAFAAR